MNLNIESDESGQRITIDGVAEFECDGVILLQHLPSAGEVSRTLNVKKMRETKIDDTIHPIEITDKGIVVKKQEDLYKK